MKHYIGRPSRKPRASAQYKVKCRLNGKLLGIRYFHETGEQASEYPLRDGLTHGTVYRSVTPGKLLSAEPLRKGLAHGTARQWDDDKLIGTYTMQHGAGLDLWWNQHRKRSPDLTEARYVKDGKWHGFEWLFSERRLWREQHFSNDHQHGIERQWNSHGRLCRGYPQYWVNNVRTTKQKYIRACARDHTLPAFRKSDNQRRRRFPPGIRIHLLPAARAARD